MFRIFVMKNHCLTQPVLEKDLANIQAKRPRLLMIWVKELEGDREHLVARWIVQNQE